MDEEGLDEERVNDLVARINPRFEAIVVEETIDGDGILAVLDGRHRVVAARRHGDVDIAVVKGG